MANTIACKFPREKKSRWLFITFDIKEDPITWPCLPSNARYSLISARSRDLIGIFIILAFNAPPSAAGYFIRVISQGAAIFIRLLTFFFLSSLCAASARSIAYIVRTFAIGVRQLPAADSNTVRFESIKLKSAVEIPSHFWCGISVCREISRSFSLFLSFLPVAHPRYWRISLCNASSLNRSIQLSSRHGRVLHANAFRARFSRAPPRMKPASFRASHPPRLCGIQLPYSEKLHLENGLDGSASPPSSVTRYSCHLLKFKTHVSWNVCYDSRIKSRCNFQRKIQQTGKLHPRASLLSPRHKTSRHWDIFVNYMLHYMLSHEKKDCLPFQR